MSFPKELRVLAKTLKLLTESQLGYEGRRVGEAASKTLLRTIIAAGPVQRPFKDFEDLERELDQGNIPLQTTTPARRPLRTAAGRSEEGCQRASVDGGIEPRGAALPAQRCPHRRRQVRQPETQNSAAAAGHPNIKRDQKVYNPTLPKNYRVNAQVGTDGKLADSRERRVPSSRLSRMANFGMLAVGLGSGAAAEATRRAFGGQSSGTSAFLTPANAERIVNTLCRVRGAALKIGQMLSLQDESLVPPYLLEIFELDAQMTNELGPDWRTKFSEFEERPFAAASIGQVHRAKSLEGIELAVKVQYPGVASGIDADIDNLMGILNMSGLLPKGMFIPEFVTVARRELKAECDYELEAEAMSRFRDLLHEDDHYYVPGVFKHLSSKCVITTEFIYGKPLDKCVDEPQEVRDYIAAKFIELCLKELFEWNFMQTDPNWSNFFFGLHPTTKTPKIILLDFGASRSRPTTTTVETMLHYSRKIGFLTGYESKIMEDAHCDSISILGETMASKEPYDFSKQDVTLRIHKLIPVMLEHRLSAPPEEVYSLHRKLSGAYLLATKLKAVVSCGPIFIDIYNRYKFDPEPRLASTAALTKPTYPRQPKSGKLGWQKQVASQLSRELAAENRRFSIEKQRKLDEVKIACFIRDGRPQQLVHAFVSNFLELLTSIPLVSRNVVLMYGFCLMRLEEYQKRAKVENLSETATLLDELNQRPELTEMRLNFRQDRLMLKDEDFKKILRHFGWDSESSGGEMPYLGYDEKSPLAKELMEPCPSADYRGSPFILPEMSKKKIMQLFRQEMANELQFCIAVKNHSRNSDEKPMEKMIADWKWKEAIARTFNSMRDKIDNADVKLYVNGLEGSKVAHALLECVISALCQGRHVITIPELRHDMTRAILVLSHREFIEASMSNCREASASLSSHQAYVLSELQLFEKVCDEYFRYYEEERLARIYTCREWWFLCARKFRLNPDFQLPFSHLYHNVTEELGTFLMDVVMNACRVPQNKLTKQTQQRAFTYRNVSLEEQSAVMGENEKKILLNKMIQLNPVLVNLINDHQFEKLLFPAHKLPMTLPPRPWMDGGACGPQYTRSAEVLRNLYDYPERNVNVEMRKRLKSPAQSRPAFDALNDLGTTPWIVNKAMLKELIHGFDLSKNVDMTKTLEKLAVPMHRNTIRVPTHEESTLGLYEQSKRRNESNSLWCWLMYRIVLAHHFQHQVLYFPHNMDFRGRVYPISPHLNHMGDDINRCLLKFARGKKLGENGLQWVKLHCINLTGSKKRESIAKRLAFAEECMPHILHSANDPWAADSWWMKSDEPWQTLAACMEIRDILESGVDPAEFVSHLPIHQDGSCNGLQHYAALGRDQQGAMEVNLLPRDTPADIYSNVAKSVEMKRRDDEKSEIEEVRTLALGAAFPPFSAYIANKTLGSLSEAFESSMKLKDWFRQCSGATNKLMKPVEWVTPLGLPVMQPYLKSGKKHGHLCLLPVRHKQVDAFPPNFVHSLDSTHMLLTALHCRRRGDHPLVEELSESFKQRYLDEMITTYMPEAEVEAFRKMYTPSMKRGELDIEQIRNSVYFFS
ncbi:DNA-directed RNA polymerase [Aphelenchoides fujianensis]|nr:DNA-directed RNA polymerase [Aphelenchoides fujianensis]